MPHRETAPGADSTSANPPVSTRRVPADRVCLGTGGSSPRFPLAPSAPSAVDGPRVVAGALYRARALLSVVSDTRGGDPERRLADLCFNSSRACEWRIPSFRLTRPGSSLEVRSACCLSRPARRVCCGSCCDTQRCPPSGALWRRGGFGRKPLWGSSRLVRIPQSRLRYCTYYVKYTARAPDGHRRLLQAESRRLDRGLADDGHAERPTRSHLTSICTDEGALSASDAALYLWPRGLRGGCRAAPSQLKCGSLGGRKQRRRAVLRAMGLDDTAR
jgi:hypothetical protein